MNISSNIKPKNSMLNLAPVKIAPIKSNNLDVSNIIEDKNTVNVGTLNYATAAVSASNYVPEKLSIQPGATVHVNQVVDKLNTNMSTISLLLMPIFATIAKSGAFENKNNQEILGLIQNLLSTQVYLSQVQTKVLKDNYTDTLDKLAKQNRASGIMSIIVGVLEDIVGIISEVASGGTSVLGYLMIADGTLKMIGGIAVTIDPDLNNGENWASDLEKNGIFGLLEMAGVSETAVTDMSAIFMIVTSFVSLGSGCVASGLKAFASGASKASRALHILSALNSFCMLTGILYSASKSLQGSESDKNLQALMFGLYGYLAYWLLYGINQIPGVINEDNQDEVEMYEMLVSAAIGFGATFGGMKLEGKYARGERSFNNIIFGEIDEESGVRQQNKAQKALYVAFTKLMTVLFAKELPNKAQAFMRILFSVNATDNDLQRLEKLATQAGQVSNRLNLYRVLTQIIHDVQMIINAYQQQAIANNQALTNIRQVEANLWLTLFSRQVDGQQQDYDKIIKHIGEMSNFAGQLQDSLRQIVRTESNGTL